MLVSTTNGTCEYIKLWQCCWVLSVKFKCSERSTVQNNRSDCVVFRTAKPRVKNVHRTFSQIHLRGDDSASRRSKAREVLSQMMFEETGMCPKTSNDTILGKSSCTTYWQQENKKSTIIYSVQFSLCLCLCLSLSLCVSLSVSLPPPPPPPPPLSGEDNLTVSEQRNENKMAPSTYPYIEHQSKHLTSFKLESLLVFQKFACVYIVFSRVYVTWPRETWHDCEKREDETKELRVSI